MNFERYIGVYWVDHGRTFSGFDCWGLVRLFYQHELGVELDSYLDAYAFGCGAREAGGAIAARIHNWTEVTQNRPGDVAVLNRGGVPCHVGIIAPRRHLLHVESAAAPSILQRIDQAMSNRIVGTYRLIQ